MAVSDLGLPLLRARGSPRPAATRSQPKYPAEGYWGP